MMSLTSCNATFSNRYSSLHFLHTVAGICFQMRFKKNVWADIAARRAEPAALGRGILEDTRLFYSGRNFYRFVLVSSPRKCLYILNPKSHCLNLLGRILAMPMHPR
ncbi:unnamed protein product [Ixodes pacificus]